MSIFIESGFAFCFKMKALIVRGVGVKMLILQYGSPFKGTVPRDGGV
jgi:hypothetical protein